MAQFKAFEAGVEVNGETVLAVVDGAVMKDKVIKILEKNGIVSPTPGRWYRQQAWLDAFREISENIGPRMLHVIGNKIPDNAKFPPEIDTVAAALDAIDVAYYMNHRNGEIGHYRFESTGDHQARMICNNPYPCDFDRGIIHSMAMRFLPPSSVMVTVEHAEEAGCRKEGDDTCIYEVTW